MPTTQAMLFAAMCFVLGFWMGWESRAWSVRWRFNRKFEKVWREHEKAKESDRCPPTT